MLLRVDRIESDEESTLGRLYIDGRFECWTLEDQHRDGPKVYGKTRIPAGRYRIQLRAEGGYHSRYIERFGPEWHKGMLHVTSVPGFEWILIHIGNTHDNTDGCLLVGRGHGRAPDGHYMVTDSTTAYREVYPKVLRALQAGQGVEIEYRDLDPAAQPKRTEVAAVSAEDDKKNHAGAAATATAVAGGSVAAVGATLAGADDEGATAEAGVEPGVVPAPSSGAEPAGASAPPPDVLEQLIAFVTNPANRLQVILIGLGVLIVLFAFYIMFRRWIDWRGRRR